MPVIDSTDGVRLAVHDLGGDGRPLLWCHATGFHGRVWAPVAAHLPNRRNWAVDFRCFGDSTPPDDLDAISWEGFADDVLSTIDALGLHGLDGVGHSKGGAALLLAEQRRPGTFRRLWLFEPIVFPTHEELDLGIIVPGENPLAASARRRRRAFASYEEALEWFRSRPPLHTLDAEVLERYVRDGFQELPDGTVELKAEPEHEALTYEGSWDHDAFARLAEVACPVVVAASGDGGAPAQIASSVASALSHGTLVDYPDLGHFGPLEAPARIAADIDEALF